MSVDFGLKGKVAAVTGGGGVLCSVIGKAMAGQGVKVALLDLRPEAAAEKAKEISDAGGKAIAVGCNVLSAESVEKACAEIESQLGAVDILVNGAGGNKKEATTGPDLSFFDLPTDAVQFVFNLNFIGTLIPSQVFGRRMAERKSGVILNVSSMNAFRPLTKIAAYSGAKAAISNFTQWLAVHMAQEYCPDIRVNAIAPGFFLTEQNRFLLTDKETGSLTDRGRTIIDHTPAGRFGEPEELTGATLYLVSEQARFVSGIIFPIDGGFSAFSGV